MGKAMESDKNIFHLLTLYGRKDVDWGERFHHSHYPTILYLLPIRTLSCCYEASEVERRIYIQIVREQEALYWRWRWEKHAWGIFYAVVN